MAGSLGARRTVLSRAGRALDCALGARLVDAGADAVLDARDGALDLADALLNGALRFAHGIAGQPALQTLGLALQSIADRCHGILLMRAGECTSCATHQHRRIP